MVRTNELLWPKTNSADHPRVWNVPCLHLVRRQSGEGKPKICSKLRSVAVKMQSSVRLHKITKRFSGGVVANRDISCELLGGEIHAILGENGAGKTTLMKVLAGFYRPDGGFIEIDGNRLRFSSPKDAKLAGVGMVHQHFSLVPALTVADNLALSAIHTPFLLKPRTWIKYLAEASENLGLAIRPDAYVHQLSIGERQRVEVFRLILEGAKILILDEPTSILAPQEAEHLFAHLRRFAKLGHVILLVTHKIDHVVSIANRVTILRDGRVVATGKTEEMSAIEMADLMVGHSLQWPSDRKARDISANRVILEATNLTVGPLSSHHGLHNVSFKLRAGEILGVAGISGNGQDELVAAITGMSQYTGDVDFANEFNPNPAALLGYIPGDRMGVGLAPSLSVQDNLVLKDYATADFSFGPFLRTPRLKSLARKLITEFDIRPPAPDKRASLLSGGNIQKIILARELSHKPGLIVAVSPTAGLDIGTLGFVQREIIKHADEGAAVLFISEDLDELVAVCDRILVLYAGEVVATLDNDSRDLQGIALMMSGQSSSTPQIRQVR
jgi:general nucleoside transport system ATP-binding protein